MRRVKLIALIEILALFAIACGGGGTTTTAGAITSSITISGSSTVEPITARVAEAFTTAHPEVGITVEGPGTGDGFARFCAGETEISDASRAIRDTEAEICTAAGIEFVELHIATDGITVISSPDNADVSCLNFGDLYALTGPESEGFVTWADANALASEVGGTGNFADVPLVITAPGEESGTYDTYVEIAIAGLAGDRGLDAATRADYQASANDNVIVDNIGGNPTSLGWVGFAFYEENASTLKALGVDGGDGCVAPTTETIASFEYPMSRPLYIYISRNKLAENLALGTFVDFFLSDVGIAAVSDAGYVQLPATDLDATRAVWESSK